MITAEKAAKFFLELAHKQNDNSVTNLKLNALLFHAYGVFLSRTGKPLFEDEIRALEREPIIPSVYQKYQSFGSTPIPFDAGDSVNTEDFSSDELDVLLDVEREFERYIANSLETP